MTITQASVIQEYKTRTHNTDESPGYFTTDELQKLANLWSLIIDYLAANKDKQITVNSELLERVKNTWPDLRQDETIDMQDNEQVTRRAWKFTKGESTVRKLGLLNRKPVDHERQLLERHVCETTQEYVDRVSGHHVPLLPTSYFPSFKYPDNATRNWRDVFWAIASAKQHPDIWVHRYLRANGWDTNKAFVCIQSVIEWRAAQALDQINWEGDICLGFDEQRLGILQLVGHDKLGFPLTYFRVCRIMPRANQSFVFKRYLIHQFETIQHITRSHSRITMLCDFTGFSMDNTPFNIVHFLVTLGTKHYAESTSVLILLVDSWLFANFWSLIRPFLDASLSARIVFAKTMNDVLVFIDKSQVPEELGGLNKIDMMKVPEVNDNCKLFDEKRRQMAEIEWREKVEKFEEATRIWCTRFNGDKSDTYSDVRDNAAHELDRAECHLGQFTRARTQYARLNMVDSNGQLRPFPTK
ncbi:phosphatidylinositol transfer protein csr1 [Coemansia sp. RSA 1878]|nr:phosphatidylinositol transfer protein csr1 [Coemansia sp. RSA 1878]